MVHTAQDSSHLPVSLYLLTPGFEDLLYMNRLPNEEELLSNLSQGDEKAFSSLMDHYHNRVFSHALAFMKSVEEAEEMVQDIFVKVWVKREKMVQVENFQAYLFALSKNHFLSAIRKNVVKLSREQDCLTESILVPDRQYERKDTMQKILHAISKLSPQQKAVISLSRLENLKYDQIGELLHISKETVKFHMMVALSKLRKQVFIIIPPGIVLAICWEWLKP